MIRRARLLVTAACAVVLAHGCGDAPPPVDPGARPEAARPLSAVVLDSAGLARYRAGEPAAPSGTVAEVIGPEGGSVALGGVEVVVPPGAVDHPTSVWIRVPASDPDAAYVIAEIGPHNRQFLAPVIVRMPYAGTTAEGGPAYVVWWDRTQWVPFATRITEDGRVEAETDHFSTWSVQTASGWTILGG